MRISLNRPAVLPTVGRGSGSSGTDAEGHQGARQEVKALIARSGWKVGFTGVKYGLYCFYFHIENRKNGEKCEKYKVIMIIHVNNNKIANIFLQNVKTPNQNSLFSSLSPS